jgi:hypothetical protein
VRPIRVLSVAILSIGLLLASVEPGSAGPTTTTTATSTTSSTVASTSLTTTTTTRPTTTAPTLPVCVGQVEVDPDDTVASLVPGVAVTIPIRVTITSGLFDLFVRDGAVVLCFQSPAFQTQALACSYTPPANPPSQITLSASMTPHSVGFSCNPSSQSAFDSKTFSVTTPTTTTTSTSTTSSSTTTSTTVQTTTTTIVKACVRDPRHRGRCLVCLEKGKEQRTLSVERRKLDLFLRRGATPGACPRHHDDDDDDDDDGGRRRKWMSGGSGHGVGISARAGGVSPKL